MADVITRLKVDSQEYDARLKRATQSLNEMTHAAEVQGNKIATANQKNIALAKSLGNMQTVSTTARGKMQELSSAIESATLMYNRLSAAEKKGTFGRALSQSVNQLQGRLKGLQGEMAAVQGKMGGFSAKFGQGLSSAFSMFGPAALATGGVMAAVGGLKKVMGDMVSINMQFEQSTANLAAIMGTTKDNVSALTNQAKQLGATTQYTAVQITELQTNLARLGFTEQEILNSTKSVQALATATGADLGEAANLAGAALRGFGLNATEMERVASVLAVSTTKSALSFEKLATAVPIVAPVAKQFGFTIEDVTVLLGKLSDAGFDASSAATASRNIFLNMANSSGKLAQALGRPIRSIEDLAPALKELKDRGIDLAEMLSLTDKRSVAAFATFVEGADTMVDLKNAISGCSDALQGMVDEQLNTLQGSVTILNSAFEGLMLTFSESNGTIKSVVDSLTELLTAWTKWRNRNQGGDAAIQTYELADEKTAKLGNEYLEADRKAGMSDSAIKQQAEAERAAIEKERDAMRDLLLEWEKAGKLGWGSKEVQALMPKVQETFKGLNGYPIDWAEQMQKQIAYRNDNIAVQDYIISATTTQPTATSPAGSGEGGSSSASNSKAIAKLKAQYEEQEKAQIAALDRMAMNEEDYEAEVYRIRRETLEKIAALYQEDTAEKARANAAISQLDIQYQGIQMRLANRGKGSGKTNTEQIGPSGYSQAGISAFRSEIQGSMKNMQMGSDEYMFQAERLVDLNTFENLLKTAVQAGIQPDPALLESLFETIDNAEFGIKPSVPDSAWEELTAQINEQLANLGLNPIELDVQTGNVQAASESAKANADSTADAWQNAVAAVNNVGSALQQIEDPAAKVSGIVMQAVANIALGFAQAAASPATGAAGVFGWIAASTAGLATMLSTIAAIKSATSTNSFSGGGMVGGNSPSGDNIIARLNSGEGVLTANGVSNAKTLAEGSNLRDNLRLYCDVSGTNLRIVLDNDNRSKGGSRGAYSRIK